MKKFKTIFSLVIVFALISAVLAFTGTAVGENTVFDTGNFYTLQENYTSDKVSDGKAGTLISTGSSNQSLFFKNPMSGSFEVEFRPIAETTGVSNFSTISFYIRSLDSRYGLQLFYKDGDTTGLLKDESGKAIPKPTYGVRLDLPERIYGWASETKTALAGSRNDGEIARMGFDTDTKEVYCYNGGAKTVIVDLDDLNSLSLARFNTTAIFKGFSSYEVEVQVSDVTGTASFILYSVNGQNLSGANSAGPVLFGNPKIPNAVIDKEYVIDATDVKTYDFLDGYKDAFVGTITATAPSGTVTNLTDNKFTPSETGMYTMTFTPVDSQGLAGTPKSVTIDCLGADPEPTLSTTFDLIDQNVAVDTMISFPKASASCDIDRYNDPVSPVLTITKGGQTVTSYSASDYSEYRFTEAGDYVVTISATAENGKVISKSANITVSTSAPYFEFLTKIGSIQIIDTVFNVPEVKVGSTYADSYIETSDGRKLSATCLNLDCLGQHKITYTATVNGQTYTFVKFFVVERTAASLLTSYSAIKSEFATAPDYAAEEYVGVKITGSRSMSTARWANIVNLKDNTKDDKLIEFFVMPEEQSVKEYTSFQITLTDANDPTRKFTIRFTEDAYADDYKMDGTVCGNKDGIYTSVGSLRMSPYGAFNSKYYGWYPAIATTLYYDWEENAIYGSLSNQNSSTAIVRKVVTLDDENALGVGNGFPGFTTGEVYVDVSFVTLSSSTPDMLIMNVDGQDLSSEYVVDNTAPYFCVDYDGNSEDRLPVGKVGDEYPIYKVIARDTVDGLCPAPEIKIFYHETDGSRTRYMNATETSFTPDKTGSYTIEYTAIDKHGNTGILEIKVDILNEIPEIIYSYNSAMPTNGYTGQTITIPTGTPDGGSGTLKETLTVTFEGEPVELKGRNFTPTESGDYTVVTTVSDYLKNSESFTDVITVEANPYPVLVEATVPYGVFVTALADVGNYKKEMGATLAPWTAYDYSSGEQALLDVIVKVQPEGNVDPEKVVTLGEDLKWVPTEAGMYEIIFSASNSEHTTTAVKKVEVLDKQAGKGQAITAVKPTEPDYSQMDPAEAELAKAEYDRLLAIYDEEVLKQTYLFMRNFFVKDKAYITAPNRSSLLANATESGGSVAFVNALPADGFDFRFLVPGGKNGFRSVTLTLTDSVNPNEQLVLELVKEVVPDGADLTVYEYSTTSVIYVNGSEKEILGSFHNINNTPFDICYDNTTFIITDNEGNTVTKVSENVDGSPWTGFSSGNVYAKLTFNDCEPDKASAVQIVSICGQAFGSSATDRATPSVIVPVAIPAEYGGKLIVPAATAYDVLSKLVEFKVTVTSPSGVVLADKVDATKEYVFDVTEYGNYDITYYVEDSAGNKTTNYGAQNYIVNVRDKVPPTLVVNGEVPLEIGANSELTAPTATLSDNRVGGSARLWVWWVMPNGRMIKLGDDLKVISEYTKVKGDYKLIYYGIDVDGYTVTEEYSVKVK